MTQNQILLTTAYFGPIEYFARIVQANGAAIDVNEHYVKQSYRNRCCIMSANGILNLIVPVIKVNGNHTQVKDILISYAENWQTNHWRAITSAYCHAPFFMYYAGAVESFYLNKYPLLMDLTIEITRVVLDLLGVSVRITIPDHFVIPGAKNHYQDFRAMITPKKPSGMSFPPYIQVFSDRFAFAPNLSILDLLFNLGPDAKNYLLKL